MNPTISRYTNPFSISQTQYADALYAKPCKAANVYKGSTLNDIS